MGARLQHTGGYKMGFFKRLFGRNSIKEVSEYEPDDDSLEKEWDGRLIKREDIDLFNPVHREKYVRCLVEQMRDASVELDKVAYEYNLVTSYLTDMEEIEALPDIQRNEVSDYAKRVGYLDKERNTYQGKINRMTDAKFKQMERMEDDIEEGIQKLGEIEDYQTCVKQDLQKLEGEKHAYQYRKNELRIMMENVKGMATICLVALGLCVVMLLVLQMAFSLDVQIGYLITVGAAAVFLTLVYVKFAETSKELFRVENAINKIILLQNRVKIRYVNNTNLMDYLYLKYEVNNSRELSYLWDQYKEEQIEREKYKQTVEDLEFFQKELIRILRRYHLKDPNIWIHQAGALIDHKEMVEIRHGLILRRQKLRKQMDYNKDLAISAQSEVKDIVEEFPEYAKKILAIVAEYENLFK